MVRICNSKSFTQSVRVHVLSAHTTARQCLESLRTPDEQSTPSGFTLGREPSLISSSVSGTSIYHPLYLESFPKLAPRNLRLPIRNQLIDSRFHQRAYYIHGSHLRRLHPRYVKSGSGPVTIAGDNARTTWQLGRSCR